MIRNVPSWGERPSPNLSKPLISTSLSLGIAEEMVKSSSSTHLTKHERHALKSKLEESWRLKLGTSMEHHYAHAIVLVLVFIDVACVLCELMLRDVCPAPPSGSQNARTLRSWEEGLSWTSRSILFILLIHQLLLIYGFGLHYFKKLAYLIDLGIVGVAIALEMAQLALELKNGGAHRRLGPITDDDAHEDHHELEGEDIGRLVVVLLVWRILRIIHGFVLTNATIADEDHEKELSEARAKIVELEALLDSYKGAAGGGDIALGLEETPQPKPQALLPVLAQTLQRSASAPIPTKQNSAITNNNN